MNSFRFVSAAFLAVVFTACSSGRDPEPKPDLAGQPAPCAAFETIKRGEWGRRAFPNVTWDDVDALLAEADNTQTVTRFPINPFSSQSQAKCSVGVLALWLVEGIRLGQPGGYPSLNPLLSKSTDAPDLDWIERSEGHREAAAEAYRRWWKIVGEETEEAREKLDPLAGTGLVWHGRAN